MSNDSNDIWIAGNLVGDLYGRGNIAFIVKGLDLDRMSINTTLAVDLVHIKFRAILYS